MTSSSSHKTNGHCLCDALEHWLFAVLWKIYQDEAARGGFDVGDRKNHKVPSGGNALYPLDFFLSPASFFFSRRIYGRLFLAWLFTLDRAAREPPETPKSPYILSLLAIYIYIYIVPVEKGKRERKRFTVFMLLLFYMRIVEALSDTK